MTADDRLAILEAIGRYSLALDGRDPDAHAALFTADGVFESYGQGSDQPVLAWTSREAIREGARALHASRAPALQLRHHQTATLFDELTPDTARTRTIFVTTAVEPGAHAPRVMNTGVYHDIWRKTSEGWLLARRTHRFDMRAPAPPLGAGT